MNENLILVVEDSPDDEELTMMALRDIGLADSVRIARDGELPLNTHGGQLSAGRLHGYGFLHEACVQLFGEAGPRQVPNNPQTAIASSGGGVPGSALLLTAP